MIDKLNFVKCNGPGSRPKIFGKIYVMPGQSIFLFLMGVLVVSNKAKNYKLNTFCKCFVALKCRHNSATFWHFNLVCI